MKPEGNSPGAQRLRLFKSTAGGVGSVPGRGTKILQSAQSSQKGKISYFSQKLTGLMIVKSPRANDYIEDRNLIAKSTLKV